MQKTRSDRKRPALPKALRAVVITAKIFYTAGKLIVRIPVAILEIFQKATLAVRKVCGFILTGVGLVQKALQAKTMLASKKAAKS